MQIHNLVQGSPEWDAFRLAHEGASEAAAMLGLSKKVTRTELLHAKHTDIAREFNDWVRKNILDYGHEVEALARPIIEAEIGDDLYPVTCSDGKLSASCDGLTMGEDIAFEHKQWNEALAKSVSQGILPDEHMPQCQQILMVTGAEKVIFVVSNGTRDQMVMMEVYPDVAWFNRIRAGWDQFERDLAEYVPVEIVEPSRAEPIEDLPVATVQVRGELTMSNLSDVTPLFDRFLAEAKTECAADEDFTFAKAHAKKSREAAKQCRLTAKAVVDQMKTVADATRTLEHYADKFDAVALAEEKVVEQQEKLRKAEAKLIREQSYLDHIKALNDELAPLHLVLTDAEKPNFVEVMKNQRTLASLYNKLDTELARVKIAADANASQVRAKLTWYRDYAEGYEPLFADLQSLINRGDMEYFQLATKNRIEDYKAAEEKRHQAERERIQAEERVKAEAAAAETLRRQQAEADAITARAQAVLTAAQENRVAEESKPTVAVPAPTSLPADLFAVPAPRIESSALVNLGTINAALGITVTTEFLAKLGYVATTQKNARLYRESDYPEICHAIAKHVLNASATPLKAAA